MDFICLGATTIPHTSLETGKMSYKPSVSYLHLKPPQAFLWEQTMHNRIQTSMWAAASALALALLIGGFTASKVHSSNEQTTYTVASGTRGQGSERSQVFGKLLMSLILGAQ